MARTIEELRRGLLSGAAGTAAMTALQDRLQSGDGREPRSEDEAWEQAPAPAQVARRLIEGVSGRRVSAERIPLLAQLGHWLYGTSLGGAFALARPQNPVPSGLAFGGAVWAASYAELVPLGIYEPPWRYPLRTLARDLSYHLVYGLGVGLAYAGLRRTRR